MPNDADVPLPLSGLRVLDIATFIAAPYCATLLGDFGAEVIKVELPGQGDAVRRLGNVQGEASMQWRFLSRNKRTITLDLRTSKGSKVFLDLVRQADVVVENFRPGTLEKWGIGYETLRETNERIVLMSISGFGQTGPRRQQPAVARIAMAFGGLMDLVGEPGGKPLLPGVAALGDYLAGIYGAFGTMLALRHRDETGVGQQIDLALFEPVFHMLEDSVEAFGNLGVVKHREGSANRSAAPHNNFKSRDDKWVALGCSSDLLFTRLCAAMERLDLLDVPEFKTNALRIANRPAVEGEVADWMSKYDADAILSLMEVHGVPASLIYDMTEIFKDEQYAVRQAVIQVPTDDMGSLYMRGVIPKLTGSPGKVSWAGRSVGYDTDDILSSLAGLTSAQIAELRDENVI